jgi:MFS family permease
MLIGITSFHFIAAGVQFWVTAYCMRVLHDKLEDTMVSFVSVALTAPTLGVFTGGWLVDRIGGYKKELRRVTRYCTVLAILAVMAAAAVWFSHSLKALIPSLWMLMFLGSAVLPPGTGIIVSVVPAKHRGLASALATGMFNLFGYCLAPIITGSVGHFFGLRYGFACILIMPLVGYICMVQAQTAADSLQKSRDRIGTLTGFEPKGFV